MKKFYCLATLLLVVNLIGKGENRYLPFTKSLKSTDKVEQTILPQREVKELPDGTLEVTYYFKGAEVSDKVAQGDPYTFLHIKGFGKLGQIGAPALPMRNDRFVLSKNDQPSVEIIDAEYMDYPNYMIHPALEPARDTQGAPDPKFEKDPAVYQKNAFYPSQNIEISMNQVMREVRIASVRITPVQFNPVTKNLRVFSKLVYRFHKGSRKTMTTLDSRTVEILKSEILNAPQLERVSLDRRKATSGNEKDYIIITHSDFNDAAQRLAAWKASLGYKVEVISKSAWTSAQVRKEIADRYHQWNPKPKYYVILGDVEFVPSMQFKTPYNETFSSDLYYACMDGKDDFTPDMGRGRLSVANVEQANIVVNKVINYEKNPVDDADFYQKGVNCAMFQDVQSNDPRDGYAARRFCHTSEDIRGYITQQGYDVQRIYYTDAANSPTNFNNGYFSNGEAISPELLRSNGFKWDGDADDIANAINDGRFYVFHRDHGYSGGTGWAHPEFVTSQMGRLHNGNKLPVVFSINCHTGEFSLKECFAEKFLRLKDAGAVAVFGASYYSMSGPNDGLSIGMVEAIWPNPGILPSFGSGANASNPPAQGFDHATTTLGDVLNLGLLRMNQTWAPDQSYLLYTYRLFHLFGDPAMKMWTAYPQTITATMPTAVDAGMDHITVSDVNKEGALVTLTIDGKLISKGEVQNGQCTLHFDAITTGSKAAVTISKSNCRPLYKSYQLTATAPVAGFTMTENSPIVGTSATIHFVADCQGEVDSYEWDFGSSNITMMEGTTIRSANPVVKYLAQGNYSVSLTVTNSHGNNTYTLPNAVQIIDGIAPASCTNKTMYMNYDYGFGIYNVKIGSQEIASKSVIQDQGYIDHTQEAAFQVSTNQQVDLSVTVGSRYNENVAVYIDKNGDGTFSSDEFIGSKNSVKNTQVLSFNIDNTYEVGTKVRMRVIADYDRYSITTPCQDLRYGQAEDYAIEITEGTNQGGNTAEYEAITGYEVTGITDVEFNTIRNSATRQKGYNDFTDQMTSVTPGNNYRLDVTINNYYNAEFWTYVWIDWNINGIFEASERHYLGSLTGTNKNFNVYVNVPTSALLGDTRMRVVYAWSNNTVAASGKIEYFNAEDYTIRIQSNDLENRELFDNQEINKDATDQEEGFKLYPNPSKEFVHIYMNQYVEQPVQAEIINMAGEKVASMILDRQDNMVNIDLPSGVYFVRVYIDGKAILQKLIIK